MGNCYGVCNTFRESAAEIFKLLSKAERLRMAINEETITEIILLGIADFHSGRDLEIRSYTKAEEGRGTNSTKGKATGADWSFWFCDNHGKGIEIRIQAKKLFKSGEYDSLNGSGSQINNLIKNRGLAIPLYVFYNSNLECLYRHADYLFYHDFPFYRDLDFGCTYAPVTAIPSKKKPSPKDITVMFPWHYLVCKKSCSSFRLGSCDVVNSESLPQRVASAVKSAYEASFLFGNSEASSEKIKETIAEFSFELRDVTPTWVESLELQSDDSSVNKKIELYLKEHGLRGVCVIKEIMPG
ncbi:MULTISPECIES: DUF6615 family protein [Serratia]|uniref:DUF6615 family protein n=1 Tax=Serratia TaxID=613 RepID=UPI001495D4BA|nr:DUF6615 family protein [Serratia marcescens]